MKKIRVHALAKELGITSAEMVREIKTLGLEVKSYMSTLEEDMANLVKEMVLEKKEDKERKPEVKKPSRSAKEERKAEEKEKKEKRVVPSRKRLDEVEATAKEKKEEQRVELSDTVTVREFADKIGIASEIIIKELMKKGIMLTINQVIDSKLATSVAKDFGFSVSIISPEEELIKRQSISDKTKLVPRAPIVTVMGHVDHGKTLLLDAIRKTDVASKESGGITQHIGAYKVSLPNKGEITFLDTPGHEAFTAMRARGAKVTDIVILVVAADDGVMPQTIEAINHAKAANVPIVVAINKIDLPGCDTGKIKNELSTHDLVSEEWGGKTIIVEVSAKKRIGLDNLLEMILLEAEMLELTADPTQKAEGVIIEAKLDRGKGSVATVLLQNGTLHVGDPFVCGLQFGKVRALMNDRGRKIKKAGPSTPVEVLGISDVPNVGDYLIAMDNERIARQISSRRQEKLKSKKVAETTALTWENFINKIQDGEIREFRIVLKADVQGSLQAVSDALENILNSSNKEKIKLKIIHSAVGGIKEADVMLAASSEAIIIGFNVRPEPKAMTVAEKEGVKIKLYRVIYELIDGVKALIAGSLEPEYEEVFLGRVEVRELFRSKKFGGVIAGSYVNEGKVVRGSFVRLLRDSVVIHEGKINSLKRFKEDAKEVLNGYECGIGLENFNDIKKGDIIECYMQKEVEATL
ncbi:MAG: translation initiation factor IF-2 [bacterium]